MVTIDFNDFKQKWLAQECDGVDAKKQLVLEIEECTDFYSILAVISLWSHKPLGDRIHDFLVRNDASLNTNELTSYIMGFRDKPSEKMVHIIGLLAGDKFTLHNRKFVVANTTLFDNEGVKTNDITNGYIAISEIMGGEGFESSWLGQPDKCHADINVELI